MTKHLSPIRRHVYEYLLENFKPGCGNNTAERYEAATNALLLLGADVDVLANKINYRLAAHLVESFLRYGEATTEPETFKWGINQALVTNYVKAINQSLDRRQISLGDSLSDWFRRWEANEKVRSLFRQLIGPSFSETMSIQTVLRCLENWEPKEETDKSEGEYINLQLGATYRICYGGVERLVSGDLILDLVAGSKVFESIEIDPETTGSVQLDGVLALIRADLEDRFSGHNRRSLAERWLEDKQGPKTDTFKEIETYLDSSFGTPTWRRLELGQVYDRLLEAKSLAATKAGGERPTLPEANEPTKGWAEVIKLRKLLDGVLNWALADRGTKNEHVRCHAYSPGDMPDVIADAKSYFGESVGDHRVWSTEAGKPNRAEPVKPEENEEANRLWESRLEAVLEDLRRALECDEGTVRRQIVTDILTSHFKPTDSEAITELEKEALLEQCAHSAVEGMRMGNERGCVETLVRYFRPCLRPEVDSEKFDKFWDTLLDKTLTAIESCLGSKGIHVLPYRKTIRNVINDHLKP